MAHASMSVDVSDEARLSPPHASPVPSPTASVDASEEVRLQLMHLNGSHRVRPLHSRGVGAVRHPLPASRVGLLESSVRPATSPAPAAASATLTHTLTGDTRHRQRTGGPMSPAEQLHALRHARGGYWSFHESGVLYHPGSHDERHSTALHAMTERVYRGPTSRHQSDQTPNNDSPRHSPNPSPPATSRTIHAHATRTARRVNQTAGRPPVNESAPSQNLWRRNDSGISTKQTTKSNTSIDPHLPNLPLPHSSATTHGMIHSTFHRSLLPPGCPDELWTIDSPARDTLSKKSVAMMVADDERIRLERERRERELNGRIDQYDTTRTTRSLASRTRPSRQHARPARPFEQGPPALSQPDTSRDLYKAEVFLTTPHTLPLLRGSPLTPDQFDPILDRSRTIHSNDVKYGSSRSGGARWKYDTALVGHLSTSIEVNGMANLDTANDSRSDSSDHSVAHQRALRQLRAEKEFMAAIIAGSRKSRQQVELEDEARIDTKQLLADYLNTDARMMIEKEQQWPKLDLLESNTILERYLDNDPLLATQLRLEHHRSNIADMDVLDDCDANRQSDNDSTQLLPTTILSTNMPIPSIDDEPATPKDVELLEYIHQRKRAKPASTPVQHVEEKEYIGPSSSHSSPSRSVEVDPTLVVAAAPSAVWSYAKFPIESRIFRPTPTRSIYSSQSTRVKVHTDTHPYQPPPTSKAAQHERQLIESMKRMKERTNRQQQQQQPQPSPATLVDAVDHADGPSHSTFPSTVALSLLAPVVPPSMSPSSESDTVFLTQQLDSSHPLDGGESHAADHTPTNNTQMEDEFDPDANMMPDEQQTIPAPPSASETSVIIKPTSIAVTVNDASRHAPLTSVDAAGVSPLVPSTSSSSSMAAPRGASPRLVSAASVVPSSPRLVGIIDRRSRSRGSPAISPRSSRSSARVSGHSRRFHSVVDGRSLHGSELPMSSPTQRSHDDMRPTSGSNSSIASPNVKPKQPTTQPTMAEDEFDLDAELSSLLDTTSPTPTTAPITSSTIDIAKSVSIPSASASLVSHRRHVSIPFHSRRSSGSFHAQKGLMADITATLAEVLGGSASDRRRSNTNSKQGSTRTSRRASTNMKEETTKAASVVMTKPSMVASALDSSAESDPLLAPSLTPAKWTRSSLVGPISASVLSSSQPPVASSSSGQVAVAPQLTEEDETRLHDRARARERRLARKLQREQSGTENETATTTTTAASIEPTVIDQPTSTSMQDGVKPGSIQAELAQLYADVSDASSELSSASSTKKKKAKRRKTKKTHDPLLPLSNPKRSSLVLDSHPPLTMLSKRSSMTHRESHRETINGGPNTKPQHAADTTHTSDKASSATSSSSKKKKRKTNKKLSKQRTLEFVVSDDDASIDGGGRTSEDDSSSVVTSSSTATIPTEPHRNNHTTLIKPNDTTAIKPTSTKGSDQPTIGSATLTADTHVVTAPTHQIHPPSHPVSTHPTTSMVKSVDPTPNTPVTASSDARTRRDPGTHTVDSMRPVAVPVTPNKSNTPTTSIASSNKAHTPHAGTSRPKRSSTGMTPKMTLAVSSHAQSAVTKRSSLDMSHITPLVSFAPRSPPSATMNAFKSPKSSTMEYTPAPLPAHFASLPGSNRHKNRTSVRATAYMVEQKKAMVEAAKNKTEREENIRALEGLAIKQQEKNEKKGASPTMQMVDMTTPEEDGADDANTSNAIEQVDLDSALNDATGEQSPSPLVDTAEPATVDSASAGVAAHDSLDPSSFVPTTPSSSPPPGDSALPASSSSPLSPRTKKRSKKQVQTPASGKRKVRTHTMKRMRSVQHNEEQQHENNQINTEEEQPEDDVEIGSLTDEFSNAIDVDPSSSHASATDSIMSASVSSSSHPSLSGPPSSVGVARTAGDVEAGTDHRVIDPNTSQSYNPTPQIPDEATPSDTNIDTTIEDHKDESNAAALVDLSQPSVDHPAIDHDVDHDVDVDVDLSDADGVAITDDPDGKTSAVDSSFVVLGPKVIAMFREYESDDDSHTSTPIAAHTPTRSQSPTLTHTIEVRPTSNNQDQGDQWIQDTDPDEYL